MGIFNRKSAAPLPVPEGFTAEDIKTESSICTGETVIGFYDAAKRVLVNAERVGNDGDIAAFYKKYGIARPSGN